MSVCKSPRANNARTSASKSEANIVKTLLNSLMEQFTARRGDSELMHLMPWKRLHSVASVPLSFTRNEKTGSGGLCGSTDGSVLRQLGQSLPVADAKRPIPALPPAVQFLLLFQGLPMAEERALQQRLEIEHGAANQQRYTSCRCYLAISAKASRAKNPLRSRPAPGRECPATMRSRAQFGCVWLRPCRDVHSSVDEGRIDTNQPLRAKLYVAQWLTLFCREAVGPIKNRFRQACLTDINHLLRAVIAVCKSTGCN